MARRPLHALLVAAVSAALTVGLVLVPSTAGAAVRPGRSAQPRHRRATSAPWSIPTEHAFSTPGRGRPRSRGRSGGKLDIVNQFYTYPQAVGNPGEVQDVADGRIPMVTWGATDADSILNGSQDAYITLQATRIPTSRPGLPALLPRARGCVPGTIVDSPAYIAAWKWAQSNFQAPGPPTCTGCSPPRRTATGYPRRAPWKYYPGDAFVDWIAADGYNFAPVKPGAKWNSPPTVFGKWYAWARSPPSR